MQLFKQSESTAARRRVQLYLVDATDGLTPETAEAAGQPQLSVGGGAFGNTTNTLVAIGNGNYYVELTAAELATLGVGTVRYKSANTAEASETIQIAAFDPYDAAALGLSRVDATVSSRSSHTAADVWASGTRTLSSFGTLVADVATAVWAAVTRTLTASSDPTAAVIADAVWDEARSGHVTSGTFGESVAGVAAGVTLTSSERNSVADALLDRADGIEVGLTPRQAQRLLAAALAGELSGAATTTITIRNAVADSKARITATVDSDGNRTAVSTDLT